MLLIKITIAISIRRDAPWSVVTRYHIDDHDCCRILWSHPERATTAVKGGVHKAYGLNVVAVDVQSAQPVG